MQVSLVTSHTAELGGETWADGSMFLIQTHKAFSLLSVSAVPRNQTWHSDQSFKFIQHQGCCQHFEDSLIIIFVLASASRADGCHADLKGGVVTGGRA